MDTDFDGTLSKYVCMRLEGARERAGGRVSGALLGRFTHDTRALVLTVAAPRHEFMTAMKEEPLLAECFFGSLLPAKTRAVLESDHFQGAVQQVQMQNPRFTVSFLRRIWDRCVDKGEATKSMDRVMFRQFMVDEMQCGSEVGGWNGWACM